MFAINVRYSIYFTFSLCMCACESLHKRQTFAADSASAFRQAILPFAYVSKILLPSWYLMRHEFFFVFFFLFFFLIF